MISAQTVSLFVFFSNCIHVDSFGLVLHDAVGSYSNIYLVHHLQDSVVMERLIEKYMSLPNQAWDNIVKEATRVSSRDSSYFCILGQMYCIFSWVMVEFFLPPPFQLTAFQCPPQSSLLFYFALRF